MVRAIKRIGCVLLFVQVSLSFGLGSPKQEGQDSQDKQEATGETGPSPEEYAIYSDVLKQFYVKPDTKMLAIADRTFRYDFSEKDDEPWRDKPKKKFAIDPAAAQDYEDKNQKSWVLSKDSMKLPVKVEMITDADLRAVFHGNFGELEWIQYYKLRPDAVGFIMLSRVGFNAGHSQALLYIGSRCGPTCAQIHFLALRKTGGDWTIEKEIRKQKY